MVARQRVMGRYVWWFCLGPLVVNLSPSCSAVILESIYWNSSNPKFSPGQGLVLFPQIGDKMDIVCPRVRPGVAENKDPEYYRVYLVTREQLHSCSIGQSDTPLLNCDKPDRDVKFTFKFQEFSPNLWGLEFLKGREYYITSTSTSSLQGLDNTDGGVCRATSMKLVLRVGQSKLCSSKPLPLPEDTRFPPQHPEAPDKEPPVKDNDVTNNVGDIDTEGGASSTEGGSIGSEVGLFVGVACGSVLLLLVIVVLLIVVWRYHRRHAKPDRDVQQSTSLSLNTLAMPKRDSYGGSSDDNRSEPSDTAFPLRPSDSVFCRHHERVSGDYRRPVYMVQETPPQSPANTYYKV
ncbi:ephrin-B2a-like [Salvelinus fontinalis]|uniref:ephrin-B2a-like n=1 Tax=Salvelinus fontinalis TaxID=8038 RepID=UPI00248572F9|nr:ephrin-B2a-like [Salvelinus fontinalis]